MNLFKRKSAILIYGSWLTLIATILLFFFELKVLGFGLLFLSLFLRITLPCELRQTREPTTPAYRNPRFLLQLGGWLLIFRLLTTSGAFDAFLSAINLQAHPWYYFGGCFCLLADLILRDCKKFTSISEKECLAYYEDPKD